MAISCMEVSSYEHLCSRNKVILRLFLFGNQTGILVCTHSTGWKDRAHVVDARVIVMHL